jgi:hypothetical protein
MANGTDREQVNLNVGGQSFTIDAPKGLSDAEVISKAMAADPGFRAAYADFRRGAQAQAAARAAGVSSPGVSQSPLKPQMEQAGARHIANEKELAYRQWRARQNPTPMTDASSVLLPVAELPEAVAALSRMSAADIARGAGRGLLNFAKKSAGGAVVGGAAGGAVGGKRGAELGAAGGATLGTLIPNRAYANLPPAIGHFFLSDEDYAMVKAAQELAKIQAELKTDLPAAQAAKKLAKLQAEIAAGLKESPETIAEPEKVPFRPGMKAQLNRGTGTAYDPVGGSRAPASSSSRPMIRPPRTGEASESMAAGSSGLRPTESEQLATWLNKQTVWTPEMERAAVRAWGDKARMRAGEGLVNYRARIQGYGYAARAARGMSDIENNPIIRP